MRKGFLLKRFYLDDVLIVDHRCLQVYTIRHTMLQFQNNKFKPRSFNKLARKTKKQ